jgi:ribokinase
MISVVGSLNMDMTVTTPRIPKKGETVLGSGLTFYPGGKGANQAYALSRLGADVTLFGCVGSDDFGHQLTDHLKRGGVQTRYIETKPSVKTGIALISVEPSDNAIIVVPGANGQVDRSYIDAVRKPLTESSMVIMQLEIPWDTVAYVCQLCTQSGIPVLLNPAPAVKLPQSVLDQVSYLTPNEHEVTQIWDTDEPVESWLHRYPEKLVVTLGSQGAMVATRSGERLHVPASKARVVDTTGAGDTFNAALALAITRGFAWYKALRFANTAAGISTEKHGAQAGMPTFDEVMRRM